MIVLHVDVNSAYLSWTALRLLEKGNELDIRTVPAVIAGDPDERHGIILAKSFPAKKYGIKTAMTLHEAKKKCQNLLVYSPDFDWYAKQSKKMHILLEEYTPIIQRYSVDECYLDYTHSEKLFGDPVKVAYEIGERMKSELGFSVNVGVSTNKLLAKMASEMEKPDKVHTLFPDEIEEKLWPLPVDELFMVGRSTEKKLREMNILTIGDLASANPIYLKSVLKSQGELIYRYANGLDDSPVVPNRELLPKSVGNGTTTREDICEAETAYTILLALSEQVAMRLRELNIGGSLVSVSLKNSKFTKYSHQIKIGDVLYTTNQLYHYACMLFDQCWKGEPLRYLCVSVGALTELENFQIYMDEGKTREKDEKIDQAMDMIRNKYGKKAIMRAALTGKREKIYYEIGNEINE